MGWTKSKTDFVRYDYPAGLPRPSDIRLSPMGCVASRRLSKRTRDGDAAGVRVQSLRLEAAAQLVGCHRDGRNRAAHSVALDLDSLYGA